MGVIHESGEVVGNKFFLNDPGIGCVNEIRRLTPTHVLKHHDAREDERGRVHLVLIRILGGGAMSGLKNGHVIGRVGAWGDAHAPNFGRCCVRQIIPVKVHRGDDVKFRRPQL